MQTCAAHQQLSARGKLPMVALTACLRDFLVLFNRLLKDPTSVLAHWTPLLPSRRRVAGQGVGNPFALET